ncbi:ATP-dependent nuclease [Pectobacterium aroidearum]|uniref:ATP-dependent nuclease n=1 Tax=Pectobacterium aroidearum TaxID=1201031 RepID=UPI0015DF68F4|nr:ATP-dependent endonuclease [Pectobacterium aroidearum]MBA0206140.1 ATP-dependent endonuclease [Pectobacterium aroidearum]
MHLHSYRLRNYRRLKDVHIELADDISIFVGSNNSGKTSATQAIHAFVTGGRDRFSLYDFSSSCWKSFDEAGNINLADPIPEGISLPSIELDLWFEVTAPDLYLVIPLLPSTAWEGTKVGIRVSLTAKNSINLIQNFQEAKARGAAQAAELPPDSQYIPWPRSLTDYLQRELKREYELRYFILDRTRFDEATFQEIGNYVPDELNGEPGGGTILKSLIHIDNLGAQRHLADPNPEAGGRSEDLSKRLSRFYKRNLNQRQDDHLALKALFDSEQALNLHLDGVFKPMLDRLARLGYPGVNNPRLKIMSALDPAHVMSQDARVHYQIGDGEDEETATLPDSYNGLGFKNLIYMVVEILDSQARWATMDNRPPLHLLFVEEPEAHLHAQLQQVFIRNILELLNIEGDDGSIFGSQMVITTHSPHILYERGFKPIRYFRRKKTGSEQVTEVLNLSAFYQSQPDDRDFLERYLKLTHCDLFFSDAAILVEGNVERLLLPVMIRKSAKTLRSACLCVLEVGGAFGHRFQSLIEFLGLTTLIITDIDSVALKAQAVDDAEEEEELEEFEVPADAEDDAADQVQDNVQVPGGELMVPAPKKKYGKACLPSTPGAATSNQTLIKWLPGKLTIEDLRNASEAEKTHVFENDAKVRVAYQTERAITWNEATEILCGRTLEEDFGLENPDWSQAIARKPLGLIVKGGAISPAALAEGLHKKVSRKSFDKTKFALAVLTEDEDAWHVPAYIRDGLVWLKDEIRIELETVLPELIAEEDVVSGGEYE